jgi:uncharacterized membrane protein (DUF373 family)
MTIDERKRIPIITKIKYVEIAIILPEREYLIITSSETIFSSYSILSFLLILYSLLIKIPLINAPIKNIIEIIKLY